MDDFSKSSYDLADVKEKVRVGFIHYWPSSLDGLGELEWDRTDMHECVLALEPSDFYKTMPAKRRPWLGCMQDVYRPTYLGIWLYLKFQLFPGKRLHILSFKRKYDDDSE